MLSKSVNSVALSARARPAQCWRSTTWAAKFASVSHSDRGRRNLSSQSAPRPGSWNLPDGSWNLPGAGSVFESRVAAQVQEKPLNVRTSQRLTSETPRTRKDRDDTSRIAEETLWEFHKGNERFLAARKTGVASDKADVENVTSALFSNMVRPTQVRALVCCDADTLTSPSELLDASLTDLRVLRICGSVMTKNDGTVGSIETMLEQEPTPLVIVMGQSNNPVVQGAVRLAMLKRGRRDVPPLRRPTDGLRLVDLVLPAAEDAVLEQPHASFDKLCTLASRLNVWRSIEALLQSSSSIASGVAAGKFDVHGAYLDDDTGHIRFLGQHPSQDALLANPPSGEDIRTAEDPPIPAEEAFAMLFVGNRRYAAGLAGRMQVADDVVRKAISQGGQNPIAVVVGCADSRAPIEILFDMRPGDLFVLRNAGNTCSQHGGIFVGSAEYAIQNLGSKLVVIMGHSMCGAVTAAITVARQGGDADSSNIGQVLGEIMDSAKKAVKMLPDASVGDQVTLATKLNVMQTMKKFISASECVTTGVREMDIQVHGAVYDLYSGQVEWLGQYPDLESLVDCEMPLHAWKVNPYVSGGSISDGRATVVKKNVQRLKEGNLRFVHGEKATQSSDLESKVMIVRTGANVWPMSTVFDTPPRSILVQQSLGGLQNTQEGIDTPTSAVEFGIVHYQPRLVVILGMSDSMLVGDALAQISGAVAPSGPKQRVLADLTASALRAHTQVEAEPTGTAAGRALREKRLTVELNVLYSIEQLLVSPIIRNAVNDGDVELHGAIMNRQTGEVEFLGEHPQLDEIIDQYEQQQATFIQNSMVGPM